jgi:hypothetical protein
MVATIHILLAISSNSTADLFLRLFLYLVQDWLCHTRERKVIAHREAHADATIVFDATSIPMADGKVNISEPSINKQIDNAIEYYKGKDI